MKLSYIFLLCIIGNANYLLSSIYTRSEKDIYTISKLDYKNTQDIQSACQIFTDPTVARQTACTCPGVMRRKILYSSLHHDSQYLICKDPAGSVCGILNYSEIIDEKAAEYIILATHPKYQGAGIASKLMHVAEKLVDPSIEIVVLQVYYDNSPAIACYQKNGFKIEPISRAKAFFGHHIINRFCPCSSPCNIVHGMMKFRTIRHDHLESKDV